MLTAVKRTVVEVPESPASTEVPTLSDVILSRKCLHSWVLITDSVSGKGLAIGHVRPSDCFRPAFEPTDLWPSIFTARCYASAVLAMGLCPCLCLSVSATSRCSTKTAKCRITQTTPHDTPGTLVFWCQRSPRNSTGVTPYEGAECRWGGSKSATFDKYPAISRKR